MRKANMTASQVSPADEAKLLAALPPDVRKAFLALDPSERSFLLSADDKERTHYMQLPPREQGRFARLPKPQRQSYMQMSNSDRKLAEAMNEEELARFLSDDVSNSSAFVMEARPPPAAPAPARRVPTGELPQAAVRTPSTGATVAKHLKTTVGLLAEKTQALERGCALANNLIALGVPEAAARTRAVQLVLSSPEVVPRLARALAVQLGPDLSRRSLTVLTDVIPKVITGEMDLETILSTLATSLKKLLAPRRGRAGQAVDYPERLSPLAFPMRGGFAV